MIVIAAGSTSGSWTFNDCATIGAAAADNVIFTLGFGAAVGAVINLDWPMQVGITLSDVPSGAPIIAVSYS